MAEESKCPKCGAAREAEAAVCPDCGYAFTLTYTDEQSHQAAAEAAAGNSAEARQSQAEEARRRAREVARQILAKAKAEEEADGSLAAERRRRAEEERRRELAAARPKRDGEERSQALDAGIRQVEATAEEVLGPHVLAAGRAAAERERKLEAVIRREQKAAQETLAGEAAANATEPGADRPAKPAKDELPDLMRCPFCKELVMSNAGTCPGCGEPIVPGLLVPGMMRSEAPRRGRGCMLFFLFCMAFLAVLGFFALRMAMQPPKQRVQMPVGGTVVAAAVCQAPLHRRG